MNVLGLAYTAGQYRCEARSLAGVASITQSLLVHGTVSSVCAAAYCLNGATCSVVTLGPGELQPVCSCQEGFTGRRCELKTVTTSHFTTPAIIISLASLTLISLLIIIIYFSRRLRQIEKILRQQETTQKLLSQRVAAKTDSEPAARTGVAQLSHSHSYHHCGHVKAGPGNGSVESSVRLTAVTKSASSPGMTALTSSQSSVQSSGSLQHRRPAAPDSLRLELAEERLIPPSSVSPGVSPLYVEPWDGLREVCVHGTEKHSQCQGCRREADIILSHCHTYCS